MRRITISAFVAAAFLLTAVADGRAQDTPTAPEPSGTGTMQDGAMAGTQASPLGTVARSTFTTSMLDREPQDEVSELANDRSRVFYFTELTGMTGQRAVHRWEFNGQVMAEVPFRVGGPRWRVFSSKNLDPLWLGDWSVTVVDGDGRELTKDSFSFVRASTPVPAAPQESQPESMPGESMPGGLPPLND